ncbi:MAG: hypothetical protein A2622_00975 [Bdellovibrionales bacterium RIFCSPHIGHO2_01_FULL_40_29]|nr:MAG: hypothetical protein A2622_00975 [Bdellovibrionales bacterium RIFCSPHIGHO2_01_FULL_40_29]OFZ32687.1 MAG: hypothetical protein A3D17_05575 [Bdellovibrionales bacterium RIFCSPHIGHO2_02_FULL_40_15]
MKISTVIISGLILLATSMAAGKIAPPQLKQTETKPSALNEKKLLEELTGVKATDETLATKKMKKAPLPVQHFMAGQKAAEQKNYILAIKHFNTVLKKYPQSSQVRPALLAKAKIYNEMGLQSQSQHNMKMAQARGVKKQTSKSTTQALKNSGKVKAIK